jgi:ATP-dependent DNA ligase
MTGTAGFRRGAPCFFAFDLLLCGGRDWCAGPLTDREQELRRVLACVPTASRLNYMEHIDGARTALFARVCAGSRRDRRQAQIVSRRRGS